MKKILSVLVGLALLVAFAGTLYFLYTKSEEPPVVYETASPKISTIVHKTVATGSVVPRQEVEIKPQVSGIIEKLFVEPGDIVEAGALIAKINIIPNMVTLNSAESRVNRARIAIENSKRELDRNRNLNEEGAVSIAVVQSYETDYRNSQEELAAALDNLQLIKKGTTARTKDASTTLVRATIGGMVLEVPVEVGSAVIESNTFNDGSTIATVADMSELIFKGKVDESEVGKIRTGMALELTIGAIEEKKFQATLEHIAPKGIEENGAIQFEIRAAMVLAEGDFIRANLSANADIVLARRDDVLAIDESLLQFDDGEPYVEVEVAPQQFERREIETGLSNGIEIEILAGLDESDNIKNVSLGPS